MAIKNVKKALLTVAEAAELSGLSTSLLCRYIRDGRLKAIRAGERMYLIDQADLEKFLAVERPFGNPLLLKA